MSDEPNDANGKLPRIVVPELNSRAMKRPVSRAEAIEFITTGVMSMGQKVYDQISAEHARVFAEQFAAIRKELGLPPAVAAKPTQESTP